MRFRLLPTDEGFFDLFNQAAENAAAGTRHLQSLLGDLPNGRVWHEEVRACERRGDELTRQILGRLDSSFVTPFDREDIHALAEEIDDVLDDVYAASDLLVLHNVDSALPEMREMADILVQAANAIVDLVSRLSSLKALDEHLRAVDALETQADQVYRSSLAKLFSGEYPALEVLKWKDVFEAIEDSVNRLEDIADTVQSIAVKHA